MLKGLPPLVAVVVTAATVVFAAPLAVPATPWAAVTVPFLTLPAEVLVAFLAPATVWASAYSEQKGGSN